MHNVIRMKKFLAVLTLLAFVPVLWAQDGKLNVNADFLTRGEIRNGGLPVEEEGVQDFAAFILERTMIGLDYTKAGFSTKITAQHSGTWGSSEGGLLNVYEAWVQMTSAKGFFFRLGRQNLSYDDQRLFGSDDWAMTARSHDALKFGYEGGGHKIHLFASYNQNASNMSGGTYFTGGLQLAEGRILDSFVHQLQIEGFVVQAPCHSFVHIGSPAAQIILCQHALWPPL